jgi:subtilase family serine protease
MGRWRMWASGAVAAAALVSASSALAAGPSAQITRVGPAPSSQPLELMFPLKADLAGLRRKALAVSTPGSPDFGAFQPIDQLARRYGATADARARVLSYLRRVGARRARIDATGLFAEASMSAGQASRLFNTSLAQFRTVRGARFVAPAAAASVSAPRIPAGLRGLVTGVVGLDTRPIVSAPVARPRTPATPAARTAAARPPLAHAASQPSSGLSRSGSPSGCAAAQASGGFTPNQYLTAYGYDQLHAAGITGAGQRVALIEIDGFRYSDLRTFAQCFGLPIPEVREFTVGLRHPLAPGGESTLDLEVLDTAAPGLRSIDVFEAGSGAADALEALTAPLRVAQKPQVISVSLGLCEQMLRRAVGDNSILSTEGALEMASASGITILAATGDQGSAACTGPDGAPLDLKAVSYPASSWWVTGVGGTNLTLDATNQIASQMVWNDAAQQPGSAGGGGVSELFGRPNYQKGVSTTRERAVPDVSMLADIVPGYAIFCTVVRDCVPSHAVSPWVGIGGTSAATPLLAGGAALVDQQLKQNGRRPLGLANPLLYSLFRSTAATSTFYDVTSIGNDVGPEIPGNGRPLGCCVAHAGYDLASGLGSVNVASFAGAAVATEPGIVSVALSLPPRQSPIHAHGIRATVSCSGACRMGAYAEVTIGHARPFEVDSHVFTLAAAGSETISLPFSGKQLRKLRAGRSSHKRIRAIVRAVMIDPVTYGVLPRAGGAVEQRTAGKSLTIRG